MIVAERAAGAGSRIVGRGRLLVSLRTLRQRAERFGEHRAATPDERRWAAQFADHLDSVLVTALSSPGVREGMAAVDRRRAVSRKTRMEPTR